MRGALSGVKSKNARGSSRLWEGDYNTPLLTRCSSEGRAKARGALCRRFDSYHWDLIVTADGVAV